MSFWDLRETFASEKALTFWANHEQGEIRRWGLRGQSEPVDEEDDSKFRAPSEMTPEEVVEFTQRRSEEEINEYE